MFYEIYDLDSTDDTAEFKTDDLTITYFMQQLYSEEDFIKANIHEWLHGLFEWATEHYEPTPTAKQDHYILRSLGFED